MKPRIIPSDKNVPLVCRITVGIIIASILLSSFSPKIIFELKVNAAVSRAVADQSALLKVFALPNLAAKIASCLLHESPFSRTQCPSRGQNNRNNTSSEYSVVIGEKRLSKTHCERFTGQGVDGNTAKSPINVQILPLPIWNEQVRENQTLEFFLFLLLLIITSMQMRSCLDRTAGRASSMVTHFATRRTPNPVRRVVLFMGIQTGEKCDA